MLQAIFYKEWIKTKPIVFVLGIVALALVGYATLTTTYLFRNEGAVSTWFSIANGEIQMIPPYMKSFFILSATVLSAFQYTSEMVNKRFKLTLHLPMKPISILAGLLIYGSGVILLLCVVSLSLLVGCMRVFYPSELIGFALLDLVPHLLMCFAAYFFVAWIVLEPIAKRRITNLLISFASITAFLFYGGAPCTLTYAIPSLIVILFVAFATSLYATARFKEGAQN